MERQRGGFGFLGGPGESQLEIDRRLIGERIIRIKRDLESVQRTRGAAPPGAAQRVPYPVVALVGYTNAGKSTLFNRLTSADVFAKDLLFATLDPTMRQVTLPSGRRIILSDTVGFISDLPTASGRRLPRDPGRGDRGRPHPACPRHRPSRSRGPEGATCRRC